MTVKSHYRVGVRQKCQANLNVLRNYIRRLNKAVMSLGWFTGMLSSLRLRCESEVNDG